MVFFTPDHYGTLVRTKLVILGPFGSLTMDTCGISTHSLYRNVVHISLYMYARNEKNLISGHDHAFSKYMILGHFDPTLNVFTLDKMV